MILGTKLKALCKTSGPFALSNQGCRYWSLVLMPATPPIDKLFDGCSKDIVHLTLVGRPQLTSYKTLVAIATEMLALQIRCGSYHVADTAATLPSRILRSGQSMSWGGGFFSVIPPILTLLELYLA